MIRITWFGKETKYSAKIARFAFLVAAMHLVWYMSIGKPVDPEENEALDIFIIFGNVLIVVGLWVASKAERRMFLPKNFKFAGLLAQVYWAALMVFHIVVCLWPDLYLGFFPGLLDFRWQSFLLYVPVVLFGILELTLGNRYFKKHDWEPDGDQLADQPKMSQERTP